MEVVPVTCEVWCWGLASCACAITALILARQKRWPFFGRIQDKILNFRTLIVGMFLACVLFSIPLACLQTGTPLQAFFFAMQMMTAGHDAMNYCDSGVGSIFLVMYRNYAGLLYFFAPVSTLIVIMDYIVQFLAPFVARWHSRWSDTYVLSCLNERTVALGKSIVEKCCGKSKRFLFRKDAHVIYASVNSDSDEDLVDQARQMGAVCMEAPISVVWRHLSPKTKKNVYLVFDSNDDLHDITYASSVQNAIMKSGQEDCSRISIYAIASFSGAAALLGIGESLENNALALCRIDWVRSLVERTIVEYPLFLTSVPPAYPGDGEDSTEYCKWQKDLYVRESRLIVIVGAGHVGIEFLRFALSTCQMGAPEGENPVAFRFVVLDAIKDPAEESKPLAQTRFEAETPELKNTVDYEFLLLDAFSDGYREFLIRNAEDISYVFVALGKDQICTQAAMRTREILERARIRKRLSDYQRPLIVAVIDSDEVSAALMKAKEDGFDYDIRTVGSAESMYTYDRIFSVKAGKTEYKRRSSRAADVHRKYKLFAFARSSLPAAEAIRDLPMNWELGVDANSGEGQAVDNMTKMVRAYDDYLTTTLPLSCQNASNHEWLLRMEHDRWNTYMRAEGFEVADYDITRNIYDTGQREELHRHNLAKLHPCLIPFEDLPALDKVVDELNAASIHQEKEKPFQLNDDEYVSIGGIQMALCYEFTVNEDEKNRLFEAYGEKVKVDKGSAVILVIEGSSKDLNDIIGEMRQVVYGGAERTGKRIRLLERVLVS